MKTAKILGVLILVLIASLSFDGFIENEGESRIPSVTPSITQIPDAKATETPNRNQTEEKSEKKEDNDNSNTQYIFPGSQVIKVEGSVVFLESSSNPSEITDWYKSQFQNSGFSSKASVSTNTNGNVLNKLSASGSGLKVDVEIKKQNNENKTQIKVEINTT